MPGSRFIVTLVKTAHFKRRQRVGLISKKENLVHVPVCHHTGSAHTHFGETLKFYRG